MEAEIESETKGLIFATVELLLTHLALGFASTLLVTTLPAGRNVKV